MTKEVWALSVCYRCSSFEGIKSKEPTLTLNGKDYYPVECNKEECPAGDPGLIGDPIPPKGDE